jgi:PAS domain-containing protein
VAQPLRRRPAAGRAGRHRRLAWSYPLQDALWRSVEVSGGRLVPDPGDWFWVHTYTSYAWLALGSFYLLRGYVGTPRRYRAQITWVLVAVLVPWAANVAVVFGAPDLPVDLTPLTFAVSAAAFSHSLFSHRMLDIVPVARETVMRHLGDAIVVFDPRGRVLQANPAAAALLGLSDADDAVGRTPPPSSSPTRTSCSAAPPHRRADRRRHRLARTEPPAGSTPRSCR